MKPSLAPMAAVVLAAGMSFLASYSAHAEADASAQISFTSLTITPASGTFQMISSLSPVWSAQAELNGQQITVPSPLVNAFGTMTIGSISGNTLNFVGTANTAVSIPGQMVTIGQGNGQASVQGVFEITGGSGMVNVSFASAFSGALSEFTDEFGQSAFSETTLTLSVGGNTVLYDNRSSIGPSDQSGQNFNPTIENTIPLKFNQQYTFTLSDAAQTMASNVPEPTTGMLLVGGLIGLGILRILRPGV